MRTLDMISLGFDAIPWDVQMHARIVQHYRGVGDVNAPLPSNPPGVFQG